MNTSTAERWFTPWRVADICADWVDTDSALEDFVADWPGAVAFDSEFVRSRTFYPAPGLYQVSTGAQIALIDPLAVEDFQPLRRALLDDERWVVMHSVSEDLELLHHEFHLRPMRLFDTQVAHAFVSDRLSISYAGLVEHYLNIEVSKGETRSDWLQRPLTESQRRYAALDVEYLLPIFEELVGQLTNLGRLDWVLEDLGRLGYVEVDPDALYLGFKGVHKLDDGERARLRTLCAWRDVRARADNLPRSHVVWDETLMEVVRTENVSLDTLQRLLPRRLFERFGDDLLAELAERRDEPAEPPPPPLSAEQNSRVKKLREIGSDKAKALGIAPELLSRRRDIEACVRHWLDHGEVSEVFQGWRKDVLGPEFTTALG